MRDIIEGIANTIGAGWGWFNVGVIGDGKTRERSSRRARGRGRATICRSHRRHGAKKYSDKTR